MRGHAAGERQHPPKKVELAICPAFDLGEVLGPGHRAAEHDQQDLRQRINDLPRLARVFERRKMVKKRCCAHGSPRVVEAPNNSHKTTLGNPIPASGDCPVARGGPARQGRGKCRSRATARNPRTPARRRTSPAGSAATRSSRPRRLPASRRRASPSSRARAPPGTPIRSARPSSSPRASAARRPAAARSRIPPRRRRLVRPGRGALARRVAETAMSHIAIQEGLDGRYADWLEQVSDADYRG